MSKRDKRRRAGRPRVLQAKRRQTTRAGREVDARNVGPTPELIAHRIRMAGDPDVSTDFPLDVLAAKGDINRDQCDAGWWYLALRARMGMRPAWCDVSGLYSRVADFTGGGPVGLPWDMLTDDQRAAHIRLEEAWWRAHAALVDAGAAARLAVQLTVIDLATYAALEDIRRGLSALAGARERKRRAA